MAQKKFKDLTTPEKAILRQQAINARSNDYLTVRQTACFLGVTDYCLQTWRSQFTNKLPFHKSGKIVHYLKSDVLEFMRNNKYLSTTTAA